MTAKDAGRQAYIVLTVAGTSYALRSRDVEHMEMVESVTRVPNAGPAVDGVVFSRGQVVPAINVRARFGFERAPYGLGTRLIVVQESGRRIGLVADEAREFVTIPDDAIQPRQDAIAGLNGDYVEGIASLNGRLILLLDVARLVLAANP